ncbi:MAG: hypothetical protein NC416_12840 [Eubacterium sp.]|nr:hypothetical protein [Eubacterium sp.]
MRKITVVFLGVIACVVLVSGFLLGGCSKDQVLSGYNHVLQITGNVALTDSLFLKGKREYGIDHYTGTYLADYKDFSETEYLFGGTSIERKNGNDVEVSCELTIEEGTAQVFWISGDGEPVILLDEDGNCTEKINLPAGGNYIGVTGSHFTGCVKLSIQ